MKSWRFGICCLVFLFLLGCTTTSLNKHAFERFEVKSIGIVIGSANRALLYNAGGGRFSPANPVYSRLPAALELELTSLVWQKLSNQLKEKGYKVVHIKTVPIEWDLYSNISDSQQSYESLYNKYQVSTGRVDVDALLFVECLLEPKGFWETPADVGSLDSANFQVKYAMTKLFLYEVHSGRRLYYALNLKGYEQTLSHVAPFAALTEILNLSEIPQMVKSNRLER